MKYMGLDQKGYSMAEYIWIDGQNGVRSKTKVRILHPSSTERTASADVFSPLQRLTGESSRVG